MGWGQAVATPSFWTLGLCQGWRLSSLAAFLDWIGTSTRVPCVCVCVCESPSVSKSFCFRRIIHQSRGQWPIHESIANEATHELGGYHDWSSWRTCIRAEWFMIFNNSVWVSFGFSMLTSCLLQSTMSHVELINWVLFMLSHLILLFTALAIGVPN